MENTEKGVKRPHPSLENIRKKVVSKYSRGNINFKSNKSAPKKLRKTLEESKQAIIEAVSAAANAEVLLPNSAGFISGGQHKTFKLTQNELSTLVDLNTQRNMVDLSLTKFGPYNLSYSRNGRHMLFSGGKGHVATMDCQKLTVGMELQLQEDIHDSIYLHNETFFATAQSRFTYIYDAKGVELHCMRRHERPFRLDFLPYHFLLTTIGHSGWIKWHDISTGQYVSGHSTGFGPSRVLTHNPVNAVSFVGHSNGVVSLWSPAAGKALVSVFAHKSPVSDVAVDAEGRYMVTSGLDGFVKVWDLRKYSCLHALRPDHPALSVDISHRGLIALAVGRQVQVLKDAFVGSSFTTYMQHEVVPSRASQSCGDHIAARMNSLRSSVAVQSVKFRPFEDILGIGHSHGVSAIVVPGAGEPNFDSFENNPFSNPKQRRESEIQSLISKLSHDMIGLDSSFVASVDKSDTALRLEQQELFSSANKKGLEDQKKDRKRARGKNKISAKLRRRQKNVIDAQSIKLNDKKKLERDRQAAGAGADAEGKGGARSGGADGEALTALKRFS